MKSDDPTIESARDPASSPHELALLAERFPREVLANPALSLVALERPELWEKICASATTSLMVSSLERELKKAGLVRRRRFALACAERACASRLHECHAPLSVASAALETLRRWLNGSAAAGELDQAGERLTHCLALHLARASHGSLLAIESARLAVHRGPDFCASDVAFLAARSAASLAAVKGSAEHLALAEERRWQLSTLRQLGRGWPMARRRVASAPRAGKPRPRAALLDRPSPRRQGWARAMKRRPGREELEEKLAEAERVLAYVAELSSGAGHESGAKSALERAGEVAREALVRLSISDDEALTSASPSPASSASASAGSASASASLSARVCDHHEHRPDFDPEAACGLEADEIAVRWPPFEGRCGRCGAWVLIYASPTHEVLARW